MSSVGHLALGSPRHCRREPDVADAAWVDSHLLDGEAELWRRMSVADRRHSILVARRFDASGQWSRTRSPVHCCTMSASSTRASARSAESSPRSPVRARNAFAVITITRR